MRRVLCDVQRVLSRPGRARDTWKNLIYNTLFVYTYMKVLNYTNTRFSQLRFLTRYNINARDVIY